MSVRLVSDSRTTRRVRAGTVPEDTAYHPPIELAPAPKAAPRRARTFGPAANDDNAGEGSLTLRDDFTVLGLAVLIMVAAALFGLYGTPVSSWLLGVWK